MEFAKALLPILVTELGMITEASWAPKKACSPINFTLESIVKVPLQFFPSTATPNGIKTE